MPFMFGVQSASQFSVLEHLGFSLLMLKVSGQVLRGSLDSRGKFGCRSLT